MEKLLLLGSVPTNIELIEKAKARGVYTIVTDYLEPEKSPAKLVSDEYWMISTHELDILEKKCREEGITAIITGISENNLVFMAELCQRLGLPCWCTPESWDAIQRKHNFKQLCRETGMPIAKDYYLSNPPTEAELDELQLPVVVKPVDLNSSTGVSYCYTQEDVVRACEYARSLSKEDTLIVEQLLTGNFSMAHCALAEGEAVLTAVNSAVMAKTGTSYVLLTQDRLKKLYEAQVMPALRRLLKAAGCKEGVCWVQNFLDADDQFRAIEMGYRNSGDQMLYPIRQAFGFDSLDWLLDVALGVRHTAKQLPISAPQDAGKHACKYTVFSNAKAAIHRIEGLDAFRAIPGILTWVDAAVGQETNRTEPLIRATFVAESQEEICTIIETINASVQIYDADGNNLMLYFDNFEGIHNALNK